MADDAWNAFRLANKKTVMIHQSLADLSWQAEVLFTDFIHDWHLVGSPLLCQVELVLFQSAVPPSVKQ